MEFKDNFTSESIYNIIEDMAPDFDTIMKECWWQQKKINCSEYISTVFTQEGLCFAFNALNSYDLFTDEYVNFSISYSFTLFKLFKCVSRKSNYCIFSVTPPPMIARNHQNASDWRLERGYERKFTENDYPARVFQPGRKGAFELVFASPTEHLDLVCNAGRVGGITIFIAVPDESLDSRNFIQTQVSEDNIVTIKPHVKVTSKGLRNYSPAQRECFFNSERQLRFFKSYSRDNCFTECLTNFTLKKCGCVAFSMPSIYKFTYKKNLIMSDFT